MGEALGGDALVQLLGTLANPHRVRVVAALHQGRRYVSELARELEISRPLLQMHLRKLESAGVVTSELEVSEDGKAMKYYSLMPFSVRLDAATLATAADTLTAPSKEQRS